MLQNIAMGGPGQARARPTPSGIGHVDRKERSNIGVVPAQWNSLATPLVFKISCDHIYNILLQWIGTFTQCLFLWSL